MGAELPGLRRIAFSFLLAYLLALSAILGAWNGAAQARAGSAPGLAADICLGSEVPQQPGDPGLPSDHDCCCAALCAQRTASFVPPLFPAASPQPSLRSLRFSEMTWQGGSTVSPRIFVSPSTLARAPPPNVA